MTLLATSTADLTLQGAFRQAAPEAALVGVACVLFIMATLKVSRAFAGVVALAGLGLATVLHFEFLPDLDPLVTVAPLLGDRLATFIRFTALITGAVLILLGWDEPGDNRVCEYHACLLCAIAGFSLVGGANDLIFLFLALELISIPTYVMLYLPRTRDRLGQEAAIKYFLLSILSSAFLLFGFSYFYGLTGTTNITAIVSLLPTAAVGNVSELALVAAVMVVAGLGFKVTAFPFHFYAPDVYQGAPIGVVSLLAFVPKAAGFAALLRFFGSIGNVPAVDYSFAKQYMMLMWVLAAVTMTVGNVMALLQHNIRRMLAYSGVAHSGYMLIGLAVLPAQAEASTAIADGGNALLFYLIAYGAMTIGAFAVLAYLNRPERTIDAIDDLAGLNETNPQMALLMTIFLFSLIGLPLTAGFVGKFMLFMSAIAVPTELASGQAAPMGRLYQGLAVVGAVNAAIAAYYYLRVVGVMYLRGSFRPAIPFVKSPILLAILICAVITVSFGVFPSPLLNAVRR